MNNKNNKKNKINIANIDNEMNQKQETNQEETNQEEINREEVNRMEEMNKMEEISLKEIIQILLKGKLIIIGVTVAFLVIGIGVHKITPKKFKSTTSIMANPITTKFTSTDYTDILRLPDMDITSYSQQFLNNYTLDKTIKELELRDSEGEYITYETLKAMVEIENPAKTNILDISVTYNDPDMAAEIANTLGRNFVDYVSDMYQSSAGLSAEEIERQLFVSEQQLDKEANILKDYLINGDNIDTLNSEISSLIGQITGYKSSTNDIERSIETDTATLAILKDSIDISELDSSGLQLNTGITNSNAYTGQYQLQLNTESDNDLQKTLLTLKITDIETRLVENTNSLASLKNKTSVLSVRLSELQAKRAEEQYKYNSILRSYNMAESVYETYSTQYTQALLLETSNLGNINIKIVSAAIAPTAAFNRNIILTEAVAGVLGLFLSVFIVLFASYWKSEDTNITNQIVSM